MKKTGIIYRKEHGPFNYNAWPTVAKDDDGVLYTVFSGHRVNHIDTFSKTYLCKSYDNGETWSLPIVVNDSYLDDRDAGIIYLGGKKFLITYFCTNVDYYFNKWNNLMIRPMSPAEKIMTLGAIELYKEVPQKETDYGSFIRITEDGFNTISEPYKIPVSTPHGPILLHDGSIGYLGKEMHNDNSDIPSDTLFYFKSENEGKTFNKLGEIPIPSDMDLTQFHEPHVVEYENGKLFGVYRAHNAKNPDLRTTMFFTSSSDGGKTWETLRPSGIDGLPPHLIKLTDGRILLTYSRRNEPNQIEAVISSDGGKTFGETIVIEKFPQHAYEGDFGYPASVELKDGSILTVYYAIYGDDKKPSIMYTKWKI